MLKEYVLATAGPPRNRYVKSNFPVRNTGTGTDQELQSHVGDPVLSVKLP